MCKIILYIIYLCSLPDIVCYSEHCVQHEVTAFHVRGLAAEVIIVNEEEESQTM